jgi:hypothetical protein
MLKDALDKIPEASDAKQARLDAMQAEERAAKPSPEFEASRRWIGERVYLYKKA